MSLLKISDEATDKIKEMLEAEENPSLFLRVGVKEGGCSGFSYGMGLDDDQKADDTILDFSGLKVVVDSDSAKYLYGVEIDYKDAGMGGGFTIDNPNAVASCGCGASFKVKGEEGKAEKCED
ncbi:iron-sulfur cluster insertion protein ErpA [Paenibacillus sp. FJAT-26967]|uniref:iron-sulfur cluster insertion protein ErpA n=1 Tax=Paenibacillus sp. FJAT-26967 TaxID=1729690 RepID=UPI000838B61E|nr:iron-sulfur cluster insertion protein ErpA [Paenibacillus sp. FJAT-26967]